MLDIKESYNHFLCCFIESDTKLINIDLTALTVCGKGVRSFLGAVDEAEKPEDNPPDTQQVLPHSRKAPGGLLLNWPKIGLTLTQRIDESCVMPTNLQNE